MHTLPSFGRQNADGSNKRKIHFDAPYVSAAVRHANANKLTRVIKFAAARVRSYVLLLIVTQDDMSKPMLSCYVPTGAGSNRWRGRGRPGCPNKTIRGERPSLPNTGVPRPWITAVADVPTVHR